MRLFYIDDSGAPQSKLIVYGWIELQASGWNAALQHVLDWRHALHAATGMPTNYELHATTFANGRGRPTGTDWDRHKAHRSAVMVDAFHTVSTLPTAAVGAVFHHVSPGRHYHAAKAELYTGLVATLDARLTAEGEIGMIIMDGDGTNPSYRQAHRELTLATRSMIEDPVFQVSHMSQLIQLSDLVAYAAYQHILQAPTKRAMWNWYPDHLGEVSIIGRTPQPMDLP
ncbi:DUF3800 domain-containing protein [Pseudonocardiaceae bacterium YIM PH 21723]|nr:DUF3800 domain-containing protein [Pseudonocardiaceae bacterium YIM PH 21723]